MLWLHSLHTTAWHWVRGNQDRGKDFTAEVTWSWGRVRVGQQWPLLALTQMAPQNSPRLLESGHSSTTHPQCLQGEHTGRHACSAEQLHNRAGLSQAGESDQLWEKRTCPRGRGEVYPSSCQVTWDCLAPKAESSECYSPCSVHATVWHLE